MPSELSDECDSGYQQDSFDKRFRINGKVKRDASLRDEALAARVAAATRGARSPRQSPPLILFGARLVCFDKSLPNLRKRMTITTDAAIEIHRKRG
jgi:hypothetical protein